MPESEAHIFGNPPGKPLSTYKMPQLGLGIGEKVVNTQEPTTRERTGHLSVSAALT
jgi:hypothetical protein